MSSKTPICWSLVAGSLISVGCQTKANLPGEARYEIVEPPGIRPAQPPDKGAQDASYRIDYNPGYAKRALAKPIYPAEARAAGAGKYVVSATLSIDESGHVTKVVRSLSDFNLPNRFAADFFNAVQTAVLQWSFVPAHKIYWQRGADGEMKYLSAEPVARTMEVRFTFDALGGVR